MTLKPVFRPVFVIALLGWLVAFGFIAELVLPNLVTRGIGFAYRQVGLASPFAQGRMLIEEPVETLEFEFTFHPFEDLPTRRPAALLGDGPETFFVAERRAPLIRETEFQSFLDEEGFDIATDERTGLLDVIVVDGAYFASLVLTEGDCVFVALYDVQARELVDRFPCFDASEHEINPNVTGGAWLADGGWVYRATGIGQTQTWTRQNLAAQDPDSPYGKVLRYRIDRAGAGVKLVEREVFTSGHRNPQGMAKIGDQIVLIEHGARGGDEINVLKEGG
ncbi:MAG: PQQ-dependent sugar dehydrogenase, partial [Pseudomonadota bacterium]